jgi:hypothetical protein
MMLSWYVLCRSDSGRILKRGSPQHLDAIAFADTIGRHNLKPLDFCCGYQNSVDGISMNCG